MKKFILILIPALMLSILLVNCNNSKDEKKSISSPEKIAKKYIKAMCDEDREAQKDLEKKGEKILEDMTDEEKEEWQEDFMKAFEEGMLNVDEECKEALGMD